MDNKTISYVFAAVVMTIFVCAWLFRQEDEGGEVGRYVTGKTSLSMLDTKEGRLIMVEDIDDDHVSVLEVNADGTVSRWRHALLNIGGKK